jgi:Arc/MetJ family transcription regulator
VSVCLQEGKALHHDQPLHGILLNVKRRTTLLVDTALLEEAGRALGTTSITATVDGALREVAQARRRRRFAELTVAGEAFDFDAAPIDRQEQWRT